MQLKEIDKNIYRSHLNVIIVLAVAVFSALGVAISSLLIYWFGNPPGQNFYLNLMGVAIGGAIAGLCLQQLKTTRYFFEVAYVWDLKHELNLINRKLAIIKQAAEQNNADALTTLLYNYHGSRQLWLLDDNVLNLQELELEMIQLEHKIKNLQLNIDPNEYHRGLLEKF